MSSPARREGHDPSSWPTLDDLIRHALDLVRTEGAPIQSTRGDSREVIGVTLTLGNPRARISATESRRMLFGALGELSWYLAGSNALTFIEYYLTKYKEDAEGDILFGAYGPRLISWPRPGGPPITQLENTIRLLRERRSTRRATVQLFDAADNLGDHREVPCTSTLQFLCRDNRLHMLVNMRSNDAWRGLPHDIFCFTMLQELVARSIDADVGVYKHSVGSLHLYERDVEHATAYLEEGYQSTATSMPAMPGGDPAPAITRLLDLEKYIRMGGSVGDDLLAQLDHYWADLVRLFMVFRAYRANAPDEIQRIRTNMKCNAYDPFIEAKLAAVQ